MKKLLISILRKLGLGPTPQKIAAQLRQPHGKMGVEVGKRMNQGNAFLYDFVLQHMNVSDGNHLLEIGYGNGKLFEKVFSTAQNLTISGIDFSETMYTEAKANNSGRIADGSLKLEFGSSDAMPFADNSFDAVYCANVVYFWANPAANLAEIRRVLKPGGTFYAGIRDKETMKRMPFTNYGFTLYTGSELKGLLDAGNYNSTGFTEITEPENNFSGTTFKPVSACVWGSK